MNFVHLQPEKWAWLGHNSISFGAFFCTIITPSCLILCSHLANYHSTVTPHTSYKGIKTKSMH